MKRIVSALSGLALLISTACAGNLNDAKPAQNNTEPIHLEMVRTECTDRKYEYNNSCLDDSLEEAYNSVYKLHKKSTFKDFITETESQLPNMFGSGILLEGGYLLTSYHLGHLENEDLLSILGEAKVEVYLEAPGGERHLLEKIADDKESDMMLMKIPEDLLALPSYSKALGDSDELRLGTFTYLIGNAAGEGINIRPGTVSQLVIDAPAPFLLSFGISNGGNFGDSGGPVFALRDGKLELVGIYIGLISNAEDLAYAMPINVALENLEKNYNKELPIKNKKKQDI